MIIKPSASIPRRLTTLIMLLMLVSCGLSPGFPNNFDKTLMPQQWRNEIVTANGDQKKVKANNPTINPEWWQAFGSAELNNLVTMANAQSYDLASAIARVQQAEAQSRISAAGLLPSLSASLGAGKSGPLKQSGSVKNYSLGLNTRYELDFWGRNRAESRSGQAALRASQFDHDTIRLTLVTNVANQWLQAVGLRERLAIAELNLSNAERVLAYIEARARSGAATPLELAQQRGLLAGRQRSLAALQQQVEDSKTTLAILLGQTNVVFAAHSLASVAPPAMPATGLPVDLLIHRPDIASAEAALVGADANIVVARAAMLPQLSLSAGVNSSNTLFSDLTENPLYNLAANLAAPIFNGGRLRAQRDVTLASREILLAAYRRSIVAAITDVETSLNGIAGLDAQITAQTEQLKQTRRSFTLAEIRYRAGADTLQTLLSSQTSLFNAEDSAVQLHQQRLQASVNLYSALGGGWAY